MPTRLRKIRKLRGGRHHGWGQVSQHRGGGAHGGHGMTGRHKHLWTWTVVNDPDYFGKNGFKRAWIVEPSCVNVGELDEISDSLLEKELATKESDGVHIDLDSLGIGKLLGRGKIDSPLIVKVASFSELAKTKIEAAEGKIISKD
jgi:large subunit ribosomal protein L15